nr:ABC transporter ATP-binding protein [Roseospira visakhapatnamensis]
MTLRDVSRRFAATPTRDRRAWGRQVLRVLAGGDPAPLAEGPGVVTALEDVSLIVRRGEAVGVVGLNGAGKTTLLRVAAGHLAMDAGTVHRRGRLATLMDLTAGLAPHLSGHACIATVGALLGRDRRAMAAAAPAIAAFSGLGDALERPVGGYSSGMALRLGFAIAAHCDPDLLLVDEVLSVGDFPFRQKCLARMMVVRERAAILLVSHNLAEVARFCDRVVVLDRGRVAFDGATETGLSVYRTLAEGADASSPAGTPSSLAGPAADGPPAFLRPFHRDAARVGPLDLTWTDGSGAAVDTRPFGAPLGLRLRAPLRAPARALFVGVPLYAADGTRVSGLASDLTDAPLSADAGQTVTVRLTLPAPRLNPGLWHGVAVLHDGPGTLARQPLPPLRVTGGPSRHWGHWTPEARWSLSVSE